MFDEEAGSRGGAADLKKDNWFHPRTSYESLRRFAGTMAATPVDTVKRKAREKALRDPYKRAPNKAMYWPKPSPYVQQRLDETRSWLLTHSGELPCELENEKGQLSQGRQYFETGTYLIENKAFDGGGDVVSKYETHGRFHVERNRCNEPLLAIATHLDPEAPTERAAHLSALQVRGARFAKYAEARAARLRWRGMEEYNAVEKANEKLREGLKRTASESNAKPLPSLESLREQFHVEDGTLMRTKPDRPVTGRKVKIGQQLYAPSRIVFALTTGEDPGSLMVIHGEATQYRNAKGTAVARSDGNYDAEVMLGGKVVNIGEYKCEAQAEEACRLYLKSLAMGL